MATTTRTKVQTLVAIDWDGRGDAQPVLDFLGDALIGWDAHASTPHHRTGEPIPTHRFTFDGLQRRDTEVHGAGFRAGFVVHIEDAS